jgi:GTP-binding protein
VIPVIALVGRPNVGKSTLFNRITKSRDAIVANLAGLTRDRKYGEAIVGGKRCMVIDTGGISGEEQGIDAAMAGQSRLAIEEADKVLFIVDAREGMTGADQTLAKYLRQQHKDVIVVANKTDGLDAEVAISDFYRLGLGEVHAISASQGRGVNPMLSAVLRDYPSEKEQAENLDTQAEDADADAEEVRAIRIAIVGRPNVGKSTLVNRLLGEDRVVVYDQPGTTRDSIYIDFEREGKKYTFIDTAGIRRRKNISETVEKFSIVKALQAIHDSHAVLVLIDAQEGLVDQDLHLLGQVIESGRALVVVVNKWDGLDVDQKARIKNELERRLRFVSYANIHFISALHGSGVGDLYASIEQAYRAAYEKFSTSRLTRILEGAQVDHPAPLVHSRRIKLRYAHFGGNNPPRIIIHGNQVKDVPGHYTRYLEKVFRRELDLSGTPVVIEYRQGENPYADKNNTLTIRQIKKRQRLVRHFKKSKK